MIRLGPIEDLVRGRLILLADPAKACVCRHAPVGKVERRKRRKQVKVRTLRGDGKGMQNEGKRFKKR